MSRLFLCLSAKALGWVKADDCYLLQEKKFRLYYNSECDETQNFIVVIEENFGNSYEMVFDFNVADDDTSVTTDVLVPNGNANLIQ